MAKQAKDKLKEHKDHVSCDFGIKQFNKTKRSKKFVEELNAGKGKPKPTQPPPPPSTTNPPVVIFLDFDGGVVTGTSWNVYADAINYAYAGLTSDEQQQTMNIVAQLFAGFNCTITADETVFKAANPLRRQRVIFTESWEWYGQAGGVAFLNTMFQGGDVPCWVFTSLLGYSVLHIGEAGTHEPGHTIGLHHHSDWDTVNCVKLREYSNGNGINSYIMGNPYALPPIWIRALSSLSCTDYQDDNLILKTKLS